MLEGIAGNEIIVGAYSTGDGVCPMLAAHRAGGRTNLISFAKAWDRFAFGDSRSQRARRATERELLILKAHLEASLLAEDAPDAPPSLAGSATSELAAARAEHEALVARRRDGQRDRGPGGRSAAESKPPRRSEPRPGDPDRAGELRGRRGWAWTRIVRRYDDYERVLERLATERAATESAATEQRHERESSLSR